MNKTEKLLAARKKLREFQLNKSSLNPTIIPHQNNGQETSSQDDTVIDSNELLTDSRNNHEHAEYRDEMHDFSRGNDELPKEPEQLINLSDPVMNSVQETAETKRDHYETNVASRELSDFFNNLPNKVPTTDALQSFYSTDNQSLHQTLIKSDANFFKEENIKTGSVQGPTFESENSVGNNMNEETGAKEEELNYISSHSEMDLKHEINKLHAQESIYRTQVSRLEDMLAVKDAEFQEKFLPEVTELRKEIQVHTQTINILVAEKAELGAALSQYQAIAQQKTEEANEFSENLKLSENRLSDLQKELDQSRDTMEKMQTMYHELLSNYNNVNVQLEELKKVKEEQQMENAELRQNLNIKNLELTGLRQEIEQTKNLLSLAELKIQQLTNQPQELQVLAAQQQTQVMLEQQISEMSEKLKSLTLEKDEMCKHYESYVKQLDENANKVSHELETTQKTLSDFRGREESLIQRLSMMEQQYQREKQKVESLLPLQAHEDQVKHLTKSMDALVLEHESLQSSLHVKEAEVELMKGELQELRELRDQSVETSTLITALESGQLGASRAVSQNQQLKTQLNEMHDAFVMLSNSKLNLTEQLQAERTVGRKLNAQLTRVESEMDELKQELERKEAVITELNKEQLHTAQIADQMQHYQAQSYQTRTLQDELKNALATIESLKSENQQLMKQLKSPSQEESTDDSENLLNGNIEVEASPDDEIPVADIVSEDQESPNDAPIDIEAQKKLETRFTATMKKVAELTDEKQRLEHLVLQLQGETETIGEYITLYQKQRAILERKAQEREHTFRQLLDQRNQQQVQLHQLKVLVADFLKNQENQSSAVPEKSFSTPEVLNETDHLESPLEGTQPPNQVEELKGNTTAKILDLLSEIKDCKDTCSLEPNFHPCLWCSGKLITV